jgi:polysaccharide deacetylase family protein (PEP-CTERM system associated)
MEVSTLEEKKVCFTFDVEDWFQVENLRAVFPPERWDYCEFRVVTNTKRILELLDKYNIKATFFVLGWIAERFPEVVKEIHTKGHEIGSHGYGHIINYKLSKEELFNDLSKSKDILEGIIGEKVLGYRAPNFSITKDVIEILENIGFKYDSSYHPFSKNDRYGKLDDYKLNNNDKIFKVSDQLYEISLPVLKTNKFEIPLAGGGYFRLYPYFVFEKLFFKYMSNNNLFVMYLHPWEFDEKQPKVKNIKFSYRLRHYIGLNKTYRKLEKFINKINSSNEFSFVRLKDLLEDDAIEQNSDRFS